MSWWDRRAARLQAGVRADEAETAKFSEYGEDDVARATVHARQDVIMVVSQLSSVNAQLQSIRGLLTAILFVGIMIANHFTIRLFGW